MRKAEGEREREPDERGWGRFVVVVERATNLAWTGLVWPVVTLLELTVSLSVYLLLLVCFSMRTDISSVCLLP